MSSTATASETVRRPSTPAAAVVLAVVSGLLLLLSATSLLPTLTLAGMVSAAGRPGVALLVLFSTIVGLAANVAVLVGAILSLRQEPSGATVVRRTAIVMLSFTVVSAVLTAVWLQGASAASLAGQNLPAAVGGAASSTLVGLAWWGAAWWLSRRL